MDVLPFNAVHVDLVQTANADALARLDAYRAFLSEEEHVRLARFVFDRDRRAFLLTRALVRTTLSRYASIPPAQWKFIANVHGRPELLDRPSGCPDLRFNISHTDGLIACAVTIGREVGVDVEHIKRQLVYDVAGRYFAAAEVDDLNRLPEEEQKRVFFDYWTLKEAYIKARGFGLALPLGDFAFKLKPPGPPAITFEPSLKDDPSTWQFVQGWPTPAHRPAATWGAQRRHGVPAVRALSAHDSAREPLLWPAQCAGAGG